MAFLLFLSSVSSAQIWLVKNVSNVLPDDCFISFGDNTGIAYCFPERYVEPQKIDDWDDDALCYVLYPVYPVTVDDENEGEVKGEEKKKRRRRSKKQKGKEYEKDSTDSVKKLPEPPKRRFDPKDSLYLVDNGEIIYQFKDILIYKTYSPLHEDDVDSYRPFQIFKPKPQPAQDQ